MPALAEMKNREMAGEIGPEKSLKQAKSPDFWPAQSKTGFWAHFQCFSNAKKLQKAVFVFAACTVRAARPSQFTTAKLAHR